MTVTILTAVMASLAFGAVFGWARWAICAAAFVVSQDRGDIDIKRRGGKIAGALAWIMFPRFMWLCVGTKHWVAAGQCGDTNMLALQWLNNHYPKEFWLYIVWMAFIWPFALLGNMLAWPMVAIRALCYYTLEVPYGKATQIASRARSKLQFLAA